MAPPVPDVRYMYLYRVINGQKQKFRFTVDPQLTILEEVPCREDGAVLSEIASSKLTIPANISDREIYRKGYSFHKLSEDSTFIDGVPPTEAKLHAFFIPHEPCPFPGCEPLREAYLEERRKLAETHGGVCPSCQAGALQRKYKTIVERHMAQFNESKISTGNQQVSGPEAENADGDG